MTKDGFGARLFDLVHAQRALIAVLCCAFLGAGMFAAGTLPSGIYPELDFPRIVILVRSADEPPPLVESSMARPLEAALASVPGIARMRTRVIRGTCETSLQFEEGSDMARAERLVQSAVAAARGDLPDGVEVEIERITPAGFPILSHDLVGGSSLQRREVADTVIRPALARGGGVGRVEVIGGDVREISVIANPAKLAALHVRPAQLADAVHDGIVRRSVGRLEDLHQSVTVLADTGTVDADSLGRLPVAIAGGGSVPLSSLALIEVGAEDRSLVVHAAEGDAVQIAISRLPGASTPDVVARVRGIVGSLQLPEGLRLVEVYDQGDLIRESVLGIRDAILIGIILTVAVLALFLRQMRSGLLAALSVPFALIGTFAIMKLAHQTLNLMSLGGMAVAIGIVIDDAIVVVEAIMLHLETGLTPFLATRRALAEMTGPVIGTTVTTVIVLLPLALLSGVAGSFFEALAITLAGAVALSLAFALFVLPLLAVHVLRRPTKRERTRGFRLGSRYAATLRRMMDSRLAALAMLVVLAVAGTWAGFRVTTGFLPEMDEGSIVLDYFLPAGSSLAETSAAALRIEDELRKTPGISTWSRRTGAELGPIAATESHGGDIAIRLSPRDRRPDAEEIVAELRGRIASAVPGARVEFIQVLEDVLGDLSGNPRPIEVRTIGPDRAELARLASEVEKAVQDVPGLVDWDPGMEAAAPVLRQAIDPVVAARVGLTPSDVADDLLVALRGRVVGDIPSTDRLVSVRVRLDAASRADARSLAAIPIVTEAGIVPLGMLAPGIEEVSPAALTRQDLSPAVVASADLEGSDLGSVAKAVRARLASVTVPPGFRVEVGGRIESQARAFRQLTLLLLLGLSAVLAVLVAQLRSIGVALLVLLSVPAALVGALVSLAITGVPLDVSSLMGVVLLTGLVVKNGILLLNEALVRCDAGVPVTAAIVGAGRRRLRPILMTTLCTVFGLLPLALAVGAGSEMQRPLAIAVIGGLATSTVATLLVVPMLARRVLRTASLPQGNPGE